MSSYIFEKIKYFIHIKVSKRTVNFNNLRKNYFELDQESPYMNIVAKVKKDKQHLIPAVVHIDGTCRVHTVTQDFNKKYFDLLTKFYEKSKIPVLLNTSFNIKGEPIVCSPNDALRTFFSTGMDVLVLEKYIILK